MPPSHSYAPRPDGDHVELISHVVRERDAGLSLAAAIARVRTGPAQAEPSIFAGLRRRCPELQPVVLRNPLLLALSRAIEDESCARAERQLLFGSFQRERFYRQSERRWRDFARTAELAVMFADFERARMPADGPAECPIDRSDPLAREWAVVCEAPGRAVCLAGLELPKLSSQPESARQFEVIWSVEPDVVRTATQVCLGLARRAWPEGAGHVADDRPVPPASPPSEEQHRLATAITTRVLGRLG
jgi:MerR family transcriptional regulator, light-induced transcriptional regulator